MRVVIFLSAAKPVAGCLSIGYGLAALAGLIESTIYALKVNQSAVVRCFTPMQPGSAGMDRKRVRAGERQKEGGKGQGARDTAVAAVKPVSVAAETIGIWSCHKCHRIWHCLPSINNKILCAFLSIGLGD